MAPRRVVVIGAGHAGVQAAARLAELRYPGQVTLIESAPGLPYERPPLSKDFLKPGARDDAVPLRKEHFYRDKGIELIAGTRVAGIDRDGRDVMLGDGRRIGYSHLVLATGSRPRPLRMPGAELPGIRMLKTSADALALRRELVPGARVVIAGGGYIGLEVAAAAVHRGCQTTVLEAQDRVMSRVTCKVVSRYFEELHRSSGTGVVLGAAITEIGGAGQADRVVTADGRVHLADVVVAGIGVVPEQELAERAGLACSDGILVDGRGQTSDPLIHAVGDAARVALDDLGASLRLESVQNAQSQAVRAADHIAWQAAGEGTSPVRGKAEVPWFWTVQHGVRLQTAGLRAAGDDVVLRGDVGGGQFSVLYLRDGRLAAIDTVGSLRDFIPARKLIAVRARLDPHLAADETVHLAKSAA
jgi:3-phenylpropionate/trans-cinnamate dioxygenase ferredoxin reductase component